MLKCGARQGEVPESGIQSNKLGKQNNILSFTQHQKKSVKLLGDIDVGARTEYKVEIDDNVVVLVVLVVRVM